MRKERQELRAKYLKDMSEILDHEQYDKFLQNYYVSNPPHHAVAHGPKGMKAHKGKRDGKNMRGFHDRRNAVSPQTNSSLN